MNNQVNGTTPSEALLQENADLSERLAALELALESMDWRLLTHQAEQEFSREGLRTITELARVMYLKNPLIKRGVQVQRLYVWGQGMTVRATEPEINEVLQDFLNDPANQVELTGHLAQINKETELQTDGNLFFVLFANRLTGQVRMRSIPFDEIAEVICNPEDGKEPWYYLRRWTQTKLNLTSGATETEQQSAYYPDWRYTPVNQPPSIGSYPVHWDRPVFHVKVGGFSNWKFGVSEIYAAIDWARAYKEFLEDWASIVRAYRRFAFQLSTPGGKSGIAAARTRLGTTLGSGGETNPAPVTGSTFISGPDVTLQPVRTAGATVAAEDGRRMLLMVAAAVGLPETFFGDVSVGTLATATSLDRPTELAMLDRQKLWADIYWQIIDFVLRWAIKAPRGPLRSFGVVTSVIEAGQIQEKLIWNEGVDDHIDLDWPPIRQSDVTGAVGAIVDAATLKGGTLAGTLDLPTVARMLLVALGEDDIDEIIERLFPDGEVPEDDGLAERPQAESLMIEAVRELREALVKLREGTHAN